MQKLKLTVVILSITSILLSNVALAASSAKEKKPKPVQDAPKVKPGYVPRAEITIRESKDSLIKEYHIAGILRAIKVTPKGEFPAYFLIDREGTGEFVKIGPDMGAQVQVPNWILFEW